MIRIEKNKFIQRFLISFALIGLVFLTSLGYFLGWNFKLEEFPIYISIIFGECLLLWLIYFILRKTNKKYYLIDDKRIRQFKNDVEIENFDLIKVKEVYYVRAFWLLFMQFGSGYLHFRYPIIAENKDQYSNSWKDSCLYSVSMSLKEAKKIQKILSCNIGIK